MTTSPRNPPPRFYTPRNPARKTIGRGVGKVMAALKNPPMPWQQDFLDVACEIDPETGLFWYRNVTLILPRQGGKTSTSRGKITHRALTTPNALMLYTAQDRNKARKRLEKNFYNPLRASPLQQFLGKPRWQAGSEALRWTNGAELGIDAVGRKTGHGDTLTEAHIDEAYAHRDTAIEQGITPTLITVPGSQKWVTSAAGDTESLYLWNKVEVGRALVESGKESRTMFWEFSADPDLDPEDPETALSSHPAIGHTITLDAVMDDVLTAPDPEDAYRAYYGWWPKPKGPPKVIPTEAWESCYADPDADLWSGVPMWTVDTSPDRDWTSIGMAARSDDPEARCFLELIHRELGTAWVINRLKQLRERWGGNKVALDAGGAAKSLASDLEKEGFEVIRMSGGERVEACMAFYDDVLIGKIRVLNDSELNTAVGGAAKLRAGTEGGWIFGRGKSLTDISALYAIVIGRWAFDKFPDYDVMDSIA